MFALKRCCLTVATVLLCGLGAGCATPPAPAAVALPSMTLAEMEALGAHAERAIASEDYPGAIALYERIVAAYPDSAPAWFRLGTVYLRSSRPDLAQRAFEQALRADPGLSKAQANLALAHLMQFRSAATGAVAGDQISAANRETLRSVLRDVDHVLFPAASLPPAVTQ